MRQLFKNLARFQPKGVWLTSILLGLFLFSPPSTLSAQARTSTQTEWIYSTSVQPTRAHKLVQRCFLACENLNSLTWRHASDLFELCSLLLEKENRHTYSTQPSHLSLPRSGTNSADTAENSLLKA